MSEPVAPASRSVTLTWDERAGEAVEHFLRLHAELRDNGYITDSDGGLLKGLVHGAQVDQPGDGAILAAFPGVTGWSDEQVLHYASCDTCPPICGMEEQDCPDSPSSKYIAELRKQADARTTRAR